MNGLKILGKLFYLSNGKVEEEMEGAAALPVWKSELSDEHKKKILLYMVTHSSKTWNEGEK